MAACSSALQTTASALGSRQLSVQRQGLRQARSLAQRVRAAQQPNLRPLDASAGRSNGAARAARAASSSSSGTDAPPAAAPKSYRVSPLQTLTFAGPSVSLAGSLSPVRGVRVAARRDQPAGGPGGAALPACCRPPRLSAQLVLCRLLAARRSSLTGPVPERVNGRLAILALMHIARTEMETGQTGGCWAAAAGWWGGWAGRREGDEEAPRHVLTHPSHPSHPSPACLSRAVLQQAAALPTNYAAWPVAALMLLMVVATFPPALAGAKEEDFGWMSVKAEKTNMRAAMLGLAALTALEWHSGFCFF